MAKSKTFPISPPSPAANGPNDTGGDDSLEKLAKQKHHLESRKFNKSKSDVRESTQDGQINQVVDPKTDNDEKVPD